MPKIIVLDESTITKIAAGEVIERPFSVVKELVENSIDSNATEIIVKIKDSGKKQITVIDNGSGMDKEDLILCTKRHATSKIKNIEDIYSIFSYGFRGEALATIAEVSKMEIISGTKDSEVSYKLTLENGKQISLLPETKYLGTTINVYNLFYNIPARQKFLKSDAYEFKRIVDWFKSIAMPNINISFKLYNDNKLILDYKQSESIKDRIKQIYNLDVFSGDYKDPIVNSKVYYTNPTNLMELSSETKQIYYINNRPILNKTISFAISKAFENKIPKGKKPNCFVFLEISPKVIDVNVHPQKLEIRVKDDNTFFYPVYGALKNSLENGIQNSSEERKTKIISLLGSEKVIENQIDKYTSVNYNVQNKELVKESNQQQNLELVSSNNIKEEVMRYKIIGQYDNTKIIIQDEKRNLLIIDQHVAEERYNFERLLSEFDINKSIKTQELIIPLTIDFDESYSEIINSNKELFFKFGFDLDFIKNSIILRKIPVILGRIPLKEELKEMIVDICDNIEQESKLNKDNLINKLRVSILTSISCKSSIKADTPLSIFEMKRIVDNLFMTKNPYTCPHGRPIIIELTNNEIYHKIGRI